MKGENEEQFKIKKPLKKQRLSKNKTGSYLLSHTPTHVVPSAYASLTSLFEMGRGVSLQL